MPLGDRSGQSCQPFWHGVRGRSGRRLFKTRWSLSGPLLLPFSPFLFFLLFSLSCVAYLQANQALATGFSMRFGLSLACPLSFGSPFIGPHRRLPFFSFMSFCLHVSSSSSFPSLARTFVRTLACTHTRTRILLTVRFRWPRLVTMRFGSSVVPLHLVLLHRQPHTLFVCLVFLIFICLLCVHMCFAQPPFRAGWGCLLSGQDGGHTYLPSGGGYSSCVFCATVDFLVTPMKLWKSTGWKFGRKLSYLLFKLLSSCSLPLLFCLCILPTTY